jgi:hypothetical protein
MADLKDALAKFTSALSFQEKGKFPSQPQQNPKGQSTVFKKHSMLVKKSCFIILDSIYFLEN